MKTSLRVPLAVLLLIAAASTGLALQINKVVSGEEAKKMGVSLRWHPNGEAGMKVWIEFKTEGVLKNFTRVELAINSGGKRLVDAALLTQRPAPGSVSVFFSADPSLLDKCVLTIVVQGDPDTRIGYQFPVKDFIVMEAGAKKTAEAAIPVYATAEQVKAMPPCKATVEHIETFWSLLTAADGKQFCIGSERGEQDVWHFVGTALKKGQNYDLPGAFLDYQNRKFYVTAEQIKAMPAGKATLELQGPCFSIFRSAEGKQFVIGDPGSGSSVWKFLGSLTEGQAYEFPSAFLRYQEKKPR